MLNGKRWAVLLLIVVVALAGCKKGPSETELFDKAKKLQEANDFQGAIASYQEIVKDYPKSPQAPQCQFMIGYLYANHLKNMDMAKGAYRDFIKLFPDNQLVKDAQWELDHLGQDVNQIEELNKVLTKDGAAAGKADTAVKPK
jgi:TolA-binding protein